MKSLKIQIKFYEPIRLMPWIEKNKRYNNKTFARGQAFARWHKNKDGKGGPIITGTLLRSAVIKAAEQLLVLSKGKVGDKDCCNGLFYTDSNNSKPDHKRQRATIKFQSSKKDECNNKRDACPLCELLSRFDKDKKRQKVDKKNPSDTRKFSIHFSNLTLHQNKFSFSKVSDISSVRMLNRVDYHTGKANDFFNVFEIDHNKFYLFEGSITYKDYISDEAIQLLKDSLKFIDHLCGALCIIKVGDAIEDDNHNPQNQKNLNTKINKAFESIKKILKNENKKEYTRILADSIRRLSSDKKKVYNLPKGPDNHHHYLWDSGCEKKDIDIDACEKSIRYLLKNQSEDCSKKTWRNFCEALSQKLYNLAKENEGGINISQRILGNAQHLGVPEKIDKSINLSETKLTEIILSGTLEAKTPFFFGVDGKDTDHKDHKDHKDHTDHTDLQVLLTKDNLYRLPRSAIRGVLRRDLQTALNTRCLSKLGGRPCSCEICRIMRCVTLMDVVCNNNFNDPPEIRHRIRINPYTGTVAESALFNMEVAPESLTFPFVLRYRSHNIDLPDALKTVLNWWRKGQAFMSGAASTGKGRFILNGLSCVSIDLSYDKEKSDYLEKYGWRDPQVFKELQEDMIPIKDMWDKISTLPPWKQIKVNIDLSSPFINGDPIRALVEGDGANIVSFQKYIPNNKKNKHVFAYKAESFRGVVRAAVAKISKNEEGNFLNELSHNNCECKLCKLFGSVHETGKIIFEDLTFSMDDNEYSTPKPVTFDHVAIDRFTGGAVDKKKFKDEPLVSEEKDKKLKLSGNLWIKPEILENTEICTALANAFSDILNGCHPLGGKSSIGYGQISDLILEGDDNKISPLIKKNNMQIIEKNEKDESDLRLILKENACYYPHYFLKPGKIVKSPSDEVVFVHRKQKVIGHEKLDDNLLTGKIVCRLTTKTPLIIPDTSNDDAFNMADPEAKKDNKPYHQSFRFFSINDKILIPGSEIRGMISSVFEAVTNSCFRVFNEKYRLSWRMVVNSKEMEEIKPGKITDDGKQVELMKDYRYPYYDKDINDKNEQNEYFKHEGRIFITQQTIDELAKKNVYYKLLDDLKKIENKEYKSQNKLMDKVRLCIEKYVKNKFIKKKEKGKIVGLIYKHAQTNGKDVPRYKYPTPTDKMLLKYAEYNRNNINQKEYKFVKPNPNLKAKVNFMFVATPLNNPENSFKEDKYLPNKEGYLKISGPNKIERKKIEDNVPQSKIPDKVIHQEVELQKVFVQNATKNKERNRLIPFYSFHMNHNGKTYLCKMTKRCERVFCKDKGETYSINDKVKALYKELVKVYHENAEQQGIPKKFRTILPKDGKLEPGDLVYFRLIKGKNGKKGKCVEILPVKISRKMDDRLIGKRIDEKLRPCHGEWIEEEDLSNLDGYPEKRLLTRNPEGLCPACRLFGTGSYKGRLRFGFAQLKDKKEPVWFKPSKEAKDRAVMLPILEQPRPTWSIPIETDDKKKSSKKNQHKNEKHDKKTKPEKKDKQAKKLDEQIENDGKVPGRKFYVHHHGYKDILEKKYPVTGEKIQESVNNKTVEPLDSGNQFEFEISFENLKPYELGLLLYSLQLEKGLAHKLGMAKAMGFGSVEIDIENVFLRKDANTWKNNNSSINSWIKEGQEKITKWFKVEKWNEIKHIKDLKELLYFHEKKLQVFYPPLEKIKGKDLPSYKDIKKSESNNLSESLNERLKWLKNPWSEIIV